MNILFTICGRAGSKGFKNKNLKMMRDIPLVYYTLAVIREYKEHNEEDTITIALNTDSDDLVKQVKNQNLLHVDIIKRKNELAGDTVPKGEVVRDTFLSYKEENFDVVVDLDITSPIRTLEDLENILTVYNTGNYDVVFSVVDSRRSPYFNMVENKDDGFYKKVCSSNYSARQQVPKTYELNASLYAYRPKFLVKKLDKNLLDNNCGISLMKDYLVLDIDSERDFILMQHLHDFFCKEEGGLNKIYNVAKAFALS
jgi:CMP-N,N'-diacetyllegionaminic acid synthase